MNGDDWRPQAECLGVDTEVFYAFDGDDHSYNDARKVCARCPVADACLTDAFDTDDYHGMRGGLTPVERRDIQRGRATRGQVGRPPAPCGTPSAYRRHLRTGETPCEPCRQAERRSVVDRRERRQKQPE